MPRRSKQMIRGIGVALAIALTVAAVTAFGIAAAVSSTVEHGRARSAEPFSARPASPGSGGSLRLSEHQELRRILIDSSRDHLR